MNNKQVILLGIDGLPAHTLQLFLENDQLPNFKKLLDNGSRYELVSTLPPLTCPAWLSMASGASPATLGVTNILMPVPGQAPDQIQNGFDASLSRAEYIWETMDDEGLNSIVIKYPGSWPPRKGDFIQVDGCGGYADITCKFELVSSAAYFTKQPAANAAQKSLFPGGYSDNWRIDTGAEKGRVYVPARDPLGWNSIDDDFEPLFEATLPVHANNSSLINFLYVLAGKKAARACVLIRHHKADAQGQLILYQSDWSSWIPCVFSGSTCYIRLKLIDIDPETKSLHLYRSQGHAISGFTKPHSLAEELFTELGPLVEWAGTYDIMNGLIDLDTQYEIYRDHTDWLIRTMKYLTGNYKWNGLFTQWHPLEYAHHIIGASLHPEHPRHDAAVARVEMEFLLKVYQMADELVEAAMELKDENTLLVVTGDHGHDLVHSIFFINHFLYHRGYLHYTVEKGNVCINWTKTVAYGHFPGFIYLNRKEWWQGGILEEADCPAILEEITRELSTVEDNGNRPVKLILDKKTLSDYGHSGSSSADLYFCMERGYEVATRLEIKQGPLAEFEITEPLQEVTSGHGSFFPLSDSAKTVAIFSGPSSTESLSASIPVSILDIAPTLTDFLGIRSPRNCEGKPITETNVSELL